METLADGTVSVPLEAVIELVAQRAEALGGQSKAAAAWGCTLPMVNMVLANKRRPTPAMLDDIGIEKIVSEITYRRKPTP